MKKVVYFRAGAVADFEVTDEQYTEFAEHLGEARAPGDKRLLEQSRGVLLKFLTRDERRKEGRKHEISDDERAAAAFIWYYFNTGAEAAEHIDGDIIIIDETGDGTAVKYAPLSAVNISPVN